MPNIPNFGWFPLDKLPGEGNELAPEPMHPAVAGVLGANLGMADGMGADQWADLKGNFAEWSRGDDEEPAKAEDDQPALATAPNSGVPLGEWNQRRKAAKKAKDRLGPGRGLPGLQRPWVRSLRRVGGCSGRTAERISGAYRARLRYGAVYGEPFGR